jgi:hypothetical protein
MIEILVYLGVVSCIEEQTFFFCCLHLECHRELVVNTHALHGNVTLLYGRVKVHHASLLQVNTTAHVLVCTVQTLLLNCNQAYIYTHLYTAR